MEKYSLYKIDWYETFAVLQSLITKFTVSWILVGTCRNFPSSNFHRSAVSFILRIFQSNTYTCKVAGFCCQLNRSLQDVFCPHCAEIHQNSLFAKVWRIFQPHKNCRKKIPDVSYFFLRNLGQAAKKRPL